MDCKTCKEYRAQNEPIPYIAHEAALARMERTIKRLWILLIILVSFLVLTNAAWIIYESQWEVVESTELTQEVDTGEGDIYVAGVGDVIYGES